MIKDRDAIYEVLEKAGINTSVRKMLCPHCDHKSVTARPDWGFAKCWHCDAKWSVRADARSASRDWGTYVIAEIARVSQEALHHEKKGEICLPMEAWIAWRGLNDSHDWLIEHDLGALIGMTQHLPDIMTRGK